jgi:hypothetical protein
LFTSSATVGASASTHSTAKDRVPRGAPAHATRGLRLGAMATWSVSSGTQNANAAGIGAPSAKPLTSMENAM